MAKYKWLMILTLALGLTACSDDDDKHDLSVFKVKGVVVDAETKAPVKGVRAVIANIHMKDIEEEQESGTRNMVEENGTVYVGIDTVYTDGNGRFLLSGNTASQFDDRIFLRLEDVDGANNGSYQKFDKTVYFRTLISYDKEILEDVGQVQLTPKK